MFHSLIQARTSFSSSWTIRRCALGASLTLAAALTLSSCQQETGGRSPGAFASSSAPNPGPSEIRLPGQPSLGDIVLRDDGTLWVAEVGAIAEVDRSGKVTQHPIPSDPDGTSSGLDLQKSPDGGLWYSERNQIGRLDQSGTSTWRVDNPAADDTLPDYAPLNALTLGPDGTIWFVNGSEKTPVISRVDTKRGLSTVAVLRGKFLVNDITAGPGGAVWFTEALIRRDGIEFGSGIGRLTVQGTYQDWPLPPSLTAPEAIVAGPDNALWFTTPSAIGRISPEGTVSHFAVPNSEHPHEITIGHDKNLWFTMDSRIGRITPNGQITLWPLPGAKRLNSIVPVPDGSFWLVDQESEILHHFSPPR